MRVLKFGGTSVATPESMKKVVDIVRRVHEAGRAVVVTSALGGVTNTLLDAAARAAARDESMLDAWSELRQRHRDMARALLDDAGANDLIEALDPLFEDLHDLLRGVYLLRELSPRASDGIVSYGERLSSQILAAALRRAGVAAGAVDARQIIRTDARFGRATVDVEATEPMVRAALGTRDDVAVVTGFLGSSAEGWTTTLGRGGSDYTAALLGAALDAEAVEIWTDVSGVMSADPRIVDNAFAQPHLSFAELMELSHFGAKVVYPPTVHPARSRDIPLLIKNTFEPDHPGTLVTATAPAAEAPVRGISTVDRVALSRLEGDGMVGVPGIAARLFGALARHEVSVILISQSSSEHSICFAVAPGDADAARRAADEEFVHERRLGLVNDLVVELDHAVLAAVGEQMAHRPGISGRLFDVLGRHGVNVRAIAQGSSELNISLVVRGEDEARALRAVHAAFFTPRRRRLDIALAGVGRIGGTLLEQLGEAAPGLLAGEELELRLVAVANSQEMMLDADGIDPSTAAGRLQDITEPRLEPRDDNALLDFLGARSGAPRLFVDCTAADALAALYPRLLERGVGVVAANKKPFAESQQQWRQIHDASRIGSCALGFEATVCAGLPVLATLAELTRSGDHIVRVDAVLSGTVNAVLDRLAADLSFSTAVRQAYDEGLTEPNPYDDLSGGDVLRKLVILSRLAGRAIEPDEVAVEPLLAPEPWAGLDLATLWQRLPELDEAFEQRRADAARDDARLRYLATVDADGARVELAAVGADHPAHSLAGPDNVVAITTTRYAATPLVVRGPGAGPAVTAGGVFADILRAAARTA
ncbi:MAG: bifunctional aspartate kinase/homoserine dehydrogenase I [Acidobacteriota bacterium]